MKPAKRRAFWKRVEQAGEGMELALRCWLGGFMALSLSSSAWWLGGQLWGGLAVLLAVAALPVGFFVGFFWLEVKFLLRLVLGWLLD